MILIRVVVKHSIEKRLKIQTGHGMTTNIPGWGWPYHCSTTGGGCERITDKIPWKDYHYVDISTCTDGIYWKETIYNNNNGNVQLEKKPACPTPPPTCQGELVTDCEKQILNNWNHNCSRGTPSERMVIG